MLAIATVVNCCVPVLVVTAAAAGRAPIATIYVSSGGSDLGRITENQTQNPAILKAIHADLKHTKGRERTNEVHMPNIHLWDYGSILSLVLEEKGRLY